MIAHVNLPVNDFWYELTFTWYGIVPNLQTCVAYGLFLLHELVYWLLAILSTAARDENQVHLSLSSLFLWVNLEWLFVHSIWCTPSSAFNPQIKNQKIHWTKYLWMSYVFLFLLLLHLGLAHTLCDWSYSGLCCRPWDFNTGIYHEWR